MKKKMIYSSCPFCGHDFQILRDTYEIYEMDPVVDQRLNDETYFLHQCNHCKKLYYLQYPFMYRFPKKKITLLLSQQEEIPNLNEKVIRMTHPKQFSFVYKVIKNDLDLKSVLYIKKQLEMKYKCEAKLESYNHGSVWFVVDHELVGVPLKK